MVRILGAFLLGVVVTILVQIGVRALSASTEDGPFVETFDDMRSLEEAGSMSGSASEEWWVNSGGRLVVEDGVASTLFGNRPAGDRWQLAYGGSSPQDTDGGAHPQNLFRLLTRREWRDATQQARFRIRRIHQSDSPNRDGSNGILFFQRYQSGDTLYYAGVRVDGAAVIKRKLRGAYETLAYRKVFPGKYHRERRPNLLPVDRWFGVRATVEGVAKGAVRLRVEVEDPSLGEGWVRVLEAVDRGEGGEPIRAPGHGGIRTDFMDVEIDDYVAQAPGPRS